MNFTIETGDFENLASDCLVIGIFEKHALSTNAKKLDKLSAGFLSKLIKKDEIQGKIGQTLLLHNVPNLKAARVLLVGCGPDAEIRISDFRKIIASSIKAVNNSKATNASICLTELAVEKQPLSWKVRQIIEVASDAVYQFTLYKSEKAPKRSLQDIRIHVADKGKVKTATEGLKTGLCIMAGVEFTKNLANQPSNVCTPSYLADQAKDLAKTYKSIKVKVLEESEMTKLGMGAFLAVTKGTVLPAKLVCVEYHGNATVKKRAPIALVGKGITFDTGGISLKPADSMVGMKYDMCGAATVLGTIKAIAEMKLPVHVVGILAAAENMPSGTACKPEDIVTTLSGQTVEIMNTDAEGRLVLCDALTYVERYKPETVIDIATLTGAVVIALGHHATGMLSNHQPLADELLAAGRESHDRAWQMPLWEEYQDQLKSPFADMSNVGGRSAGVITAACFLSRFAKKFHWAHLDVAGTAAMMGGNDRYATGRPVPMLTQFLMSRAASKKK